MNNRAKVSSLGDAVKEAINSGLVEESEVYTCPSCGGKSRYAVGEAPILIPCEGCNIMMIRDDEHADSDSGL